MHGNKVWYPEKSVGFQQDGCEEEGRGSVATAPRATQRKTSEQLQKRVRVSKAPAVVKRESKPTYKAADSTIEACTGQRITDQLESYDTIEQTNWRGGTASMLDYSTQQDKFSHSRNICPEFCGWMENETLSKYATRSTNKFEPSTIDKSTPAEGCRSNLQSRASSRYSSGRQRDYYDFRHLLNAHEYMEHYRQFYCYTTLSVPPEVSVKGISEESQEEVRIDPESFMPLGVKSLYRGDPYLRGLASRLGVRRDQQLLRSPRPTPPSITKKSKEGVDLGIWATVKKKEDDSSSPASEKTTNENTAQNSPKESRPLSRRVSASEGNPAVNPLELPSLPQPPLVLPRYRHTENNNSSNSVISVGKYLQVTSQAHPASSFPEEDGAESVLSLAEILSSLTNSTLSEEALPEHLQNDSYHYENGGYFPTKNARFSLQQQLPLLDETQKEKVISRKAHSLGLLSRDWAKAPSIKRMIGNYSRREDSQQPPKPNSRPATVALRPESGEKVKQKQFFHRWDQKEVSPARLKTSPRSFSVDNSKLDKLRSIYESAGSQDKKRRNHRCKSRPATRQRKAEEGEYSRPVTQLGSKTERTAALQEVESEDGCYWNELPRNAQSRPVTRYGSQDSHATRTHEHQRNHRRDVSRPVTRQDSHTTRTHEHQRNHRRDVSRPVTRQDSHTTRTHEHHRNHRRDISRPVTRQGHLLDRQKRSQNNHSVALISRLRTPSKWSRPPGVDTLEEIIPPGSTPNQISAHAERLRRKFEGVLDIQQHKLVSTYHCC